MTTVPRTIGSVGTYPRWTRLIALATYAGWGFASYACSMLLWVAVPALAFGWQPLVVTSGSMAPLVRTGDLVLVDHQQAGLVPGTIIAFHSSRDDVVLHRLVGVGSDGSYRTQGDSNQTLDSDLVHPTDVIGTGRMLVPVVGLPRIWGVGWLVAIALLLAGARLAWRQHRRWALALLACVVAMTGTTLANANFTDATSSTGSSVSAGTVAPAIGLTATCGAVGALDVEVDLSWTASPTSGIQSYLILHDAPGEPAGYTEVGTVDGSQTTFTHVVTVALLGLGTHTYIVRASVGPWSSVDSNPDAVSITQALVTYACSAM